MPLHGDAMHRLFLDVNYGRRHVNIVSAGVFQRMVMALRGGSQARLTAGLRSVAGVSCGHAQDAIQDTICRCSGIALVTFPFFMETLDVSDAFSRLCGGCDVRGFR